MGGGTSETAGRAERNGSGARRDSSVVRNGGASRRDSSVPRYDEDDLGLLAHRSTVAFIRRELAALGLTQPQYWILRHLSPGDPAPDAAGLTVAGLTALMRSYTDDATDPAAEAAALVANGLVARDAAGALTITGAGALAHRRVKEHAPLIRERIHAGVDPAEYAVMVRVLRRIIANTGGAPAGGS
ncbi:MarR family transcriptional regulator [Streptomyces sp. CAU 1734]|uniref:MarR family transcriptional regulator n=1 Tax=Streptomyces sp. CAU 1734 TaxID=3140360 RepID=UPI00325FEE26